MKVEKIYVENLLKKLLEENSFIKGSISSPVKKKIEIKKIRLKPVVIKKECLFQVEYFENNKAYHKNLKQSEFIDEFSKLLENFKQILITGSGIEYQILKNSKNFLLKMSKNEKIMGEISHNNKKNYFLQEGVPHIFLVKLGIMNESGDVFKNSFNKFKQINKYLEFIDDTIKELQQKKLIENKKIKIVDFGCGKSYLTFALYHYLKFIKEVDFEIIGLDLKKDVITKCNSLAKELNYENLNFYIGNIKDFDKLKEVDIIFSLHACNTATDYAILKGLELKAKAILAVPCCQNEFNEKISKNKDSLFFKNENALGKHGILFEKFTTLATDAFRANALELCGFKTKVMEFIDLEHTPKNILIRGIKDKPTDEYLNKIYSEYITFKNYLGISPLLDKLLVPYYIKK